MAEEKVIMPDINILNIAGETIFADVGKCLKAVLEKAVKKGTSLYEANLAWKELRGADLRSADLRNANLCGTNLRSADLCSADLRSADLRWANLRKTIFHQADLRSANLSWTELKEADLRWANLSGTDLRNANLCGTWFESCPLLLIPYQNNFIAIIGDHQITIDSSQKEKMLKLLRAWVSNPVQTNKKYQGKITDLFKDDVEMTNVEKGDFPNV